MMKTTGFLAGVALTVAALLLVLDSRESRQPETVMPATADATPAELSGVAAAIAEQVDVPAMPTDPETTTADSELQSGLVETTADPTAQEDPAVSTASTAATDLVQTENVSDKMVYSDPESRTDNDEPQNGFEASGLDTEHRLDVQAEAPTGESDRENSGDAGTYLFWSPFRSEWSAQGFAGRLSSATQVPVEVINAGPGEYRVAFSYQDETERLALIAHIETITGLKLE